MSIYIITSIDIRHSPFFYKTSSLYWYFLIVYTNTSRVISKLAEASIKNSTGSYRPYTCPPFAMITLSPHTKTESLVVPRLKRAFITSTLPTVGLVFNTIVNSRRTRSFIKVPYLMKYLIRKGSPCLMSTSIESTKFISLKWCAPPTNSKMLKWCPSVASSRILNLCVPTATRGSSIHPGDKRLSKTAKKLTRQKKPYELLTSPERTKKDEQEK